MDTERMIEKCGKAAAILEGVKGSRNGGYYATRRDHADTVIFLVCDNEVTICSKSKMARIIKRCKDALAILPCDDSTARKGGHCAVRKDEPDAMIASVPNKDIPTTIHSYTRRVIESRSASRQAIGKGWAATFGGAI